MSNALPLSDRIRFGVISGIGDRDGARRTVGYGALGPGRVQVEFGRLADEDEPDDELAGSASFDGFDESAGGPDEEGPDGH